LADAHGSVIMTQTVLSTSSFSKPSLSPSPTGRDGIITPPNPLFVKEGKGAFNPSPRLGEVG